LQEISDEVSGPVRTGEVLAVPDERVCTVNERENGGSEGSV
jgi:hypothetical protein